MDPLSANATDISLLMRVGRDPGNKGAWRDFVQRYGR